MLGGPRLLLAGRRRLERVAIRSSAEEMAALEQFVAALGTAGLPTKEIEARAADEPALAAGFRIARELRLVSQGASEWRWTLRD